MSGITGSHRMPGIIAIVLASLLAASATAQAPSHPLAARTLAGQPFLIPNDLRGRTSLLIVGFTRASKAQTSAWSRKIAQDGFPGHAVDVYQTAIVEDVPGPLRRVVIGGIRRDIPESLHGRFLLVSKDAEEWRKLVSYSEPDSAYLLVLDQGHRIVWRGGVEFSEAAFRALQSEVARSPIRP